MTAILFATWMSLSCVPGQSATSPSQGASTAKAISNKEVLELHEAGLSSQVIVNAIRQSGRRDFDLTPPALIELKRRGVPDSVVLEMQNSTNADIQAHSGETAPSRFPSLAESKTAFLVNAAVGPNWIGTGDRFRELREELTRWGRFQLVERPDDADLIVTLATAASGQTGAVAVGNAIVASSSPVYVLSIQQNATGRVLWSSSEQVGSFSAKATLTKIVQRMKKEIK